MGERGCNERDTFQQSTFIYYTRVYSQQSCNIQARNKSKHVYRQIENKSNTTDYKQGSIYSTYTVLLTDTAPPTFIQKPKRKDPLTDKVRLKHLGLYDTGPGRPNGSRETVAGYLHPRGASVFGLLSPALSSRLRGRAGPPHKTLATLRPRRRHHLGAAAITKPTSLNRTSDGHEHPLKRPRPSSSSKAKTRPKAPPRRPDQLEHEHQHFQKKAPTKPTRPRRSRPVRLIFPGAQRFAPPRFRLRPPSSFCEKLREKGRALSTPSSHAVRGTGEVSFGSGPRNYSPKIRPLLHMTSDLRLGSHSPHSKRGEK